MKAIFLSLFSCFVIVTLAPLNKCYSQNLKVTYDIELIKPTVKVNDVQMESFYNGMAKEFENYSGVLTILSDKSMFKLDKELGTDESSSIGMAVKFTIDPNDIYFQENNTITHTTEMLLEPITYSYERNWQWDISDQTKEIKGFKCRKATATYEDVQGREKNIIAWYAIDVPVLFGPIDIQGLPGLVVEVTSNNLKYILRDIEEGGVLNEISAPKGNILSFNEFKDLIDKSEKQFGNN